MKSALSKDFFRQIRRSPRRFFAILLIVALGTAFFSGVRAASPDMKLTVDGYFDQYRAADIRLLSTAGFDQADLEAIRETVDGTVEPIYSVDGFVQNGDNRLLIHFRSMDMEKARNNTMLEQPVIMEGRLPEAADECLVDELLMEQTGFSIGDTLTVDTTDDPDMTDSLSRYTYTIVGSVRSTSYISLQRGSSTKGDGSLDGFILLPEENFSLSVHTQVFITGSETAGLSRFTDAYDQAVQALTDGLEATGETRAPLRLADMKAEAEQTLADAEEELADGERELADAKQELADGQQKLEDGQQELEEQRETFQREIADGEKDLADSKTLLDQSRSELDQSARELETARAELEESKQTLDATLTQLTEGQQGVDALAESIAGLEAALAQLPEGDSQAAALQAQLDALRPVYAQKAAELEAGWSAYNAGLAQWEAGKAQTDAGQEALTKGEAEWEAGQTAYEQGVQALEEARQTGQTELDKAERELADARAELEEGQAEYDSEAPEAEEKLADARTEIADGRKALEELQEPQWIVLDLQKNEGFAGYAQDTDRIAAIGLVFPLIFFLVAALVSLTNMTRMVEDDRNLIGLYKALGYGRLTIAAKYLLYAGLAAVLGTVIGLLVGQKLFPWIICDAYGILYRLPAAVTPYNAQYSIVSATGAMICSVLPAFLVCQTELFSAPASLMRPRAPKEGKRIFLEHIPFIWKHLNFSKKVTCRNIFRYKKRLLMTVVGIAGCTALIFTGFGLRDSIQAIITLQYDEIQKYDMQVGLDEDISADDLETVDALLAAETGGHAYFLQESMDVMNDAGMKSATLLVPADMDRLGEFVDLRTRKGHKPLSLSGDGIVITEKLSMLLDIHTGDTVQLRNGDNQVIECRVAGITENYAMHYVYMSPALYNQLTGEQPAQNAVLCQLKDTTEEAENALSADLLAQEGVTSTSFNTSLRQNFSDMISSMDIVVVVLILSAAALAFVVLFSLTSINIDERRRELATLKVLGFYNGETAMYIYRENIVLTLMGIAVGLLAGTLLLLFVITTVEVDMVMFSRTVGWLNYLIAALMTAVFAVIVNLIMTRIIRKINMVESMKSVE